MDKALLAGIDVEEGQRLLDALDRAKYPITAALWLYSPERERYRLMIASPLVGTEVDEYERLVDAMRKANPPFYFSEMPVSVVSPRSELIRALRSSYRKGKLKSHGRIGGIIGNVYVEDAYLYRIS